MKIPALACIAFLPLIGGCAYTTNVPVTANNPEVEGFRHFAQKPLLVVSGGTVNTIFVPDPSRGYAMRFGAFLAKHDMKFVITNGALGETHSQLDATAGVSGLLDIAKTITEDALDVLPVASQSVTGSGGPIRVYDIVFDASGNVTELRPILALDPVVAQTGPQPGPQPGATELGAGRRIGEAAAPVRQ